MLVLVPENEFYWRSPPLKPAEGGRYLPSVAASCWFSDEPGGKPIAKSDRRAVMFRPGCFEVRWPASTATMLARGRTGKTIYLVLDLNRSVRYELPVAVQQSRAP